MVISMLMNYNIKKCSLFLAILLLSSCSGMKTNKSSSNAITPPISNFSSSFLPIEETYQKMEVMDNAVLATLYDNYKTPVLPSKGNQKILVIPVIINGYEQNATDEVLQHLDIAFFNKNESVAYESVSSYYHQSSYGKLTLTGKVTAWFNPNVTPQELMNHASETYEDGGLYWLLDQALEWYQTQYDDLLNFDQNQDGYVDSIYLIYSAPNYYNDATLSSFYWAFTYSHLLNKERGQQAGLKAMRYSWSSFDFLYQGYGKQKIDAHTYIHETGHLLGLYDYYDTGASNVSPMGLVDMMDYDIGDHSMYSKFALGWTTPYIIDKAGSITLNSSTLTGDFLIFKTNNMNETPFDEYIMMEFITPTGLNELDYLNGYQKYFDSYPIKGFETAGIRITYINSRAVDINNQFSDNLSKMIGVKFSNTPRGNVEGFLSNEGQYYILSTMIPKDCKFGNNGLSGASFHANSSHLFIENDTFDLQHESQYRDMLPHYNNQYDKPNAGFFKYIVTIKNMNDTSCTLEFQTY